MCAVARIKFCHIRWSLVHDHSCLSYQGRKIESLCPISFRCELAHQNQSNGTTFCQIVDLMLLCIQKNIFLDFANVTADALNRLYGCSRGCGVSEPSAAQLCVMQRIYNKVVRMHSRLAASDFTSDPFEALASRADMAQCEVKQPAASCAFRADAFDLLPQAAMCDPLPYIDKQS